MHLEELRDFKSQLMKDLLTNERIIQLLDDSKLVDDGLCLAYTQVFPYEYLPETVNHAKTFICFDVDIEQSYTNTKTFYRVVLRIWAFTHKTNMRLPDGGIRIDELIGEISKIVNGSKFYGLGEIDLASVSRFAPMSDWQGKSMVFYATDFSKKHGQYSRKPPANRKLGV